MDSTPGVSVVKLYAVSFGDAVGVAEALAIAVAELPWQ
jgi:hypothetical protein